MDSCKDFGLEGNVDVVWECVQTTSDGSIHTVIHTESKVTWVFSELEKKHIGGGNFTFDYKSTSTGNGPTCVHTQSAAGDLKESGRLLVVDDPAFQNLFGFRYQATGWIDTQVSSSYSCGASGLAPYTITWLPAVTGAPGTNGIYKGEMTSPSCIGTSSTGTEVVKWDFAVPTE